MTAAGRWHLFQVFGIELEFMIVRSDDLSVLPVADQVLHAVAGSYDSEVELGDVAWSNELALHVIEMKTNGPAPSLEPLAERFQEHVQKINQTLAPLGGRLMPTGMHPWMDPATEMRLWPHEYSPIYEAYHRVFDCRGHGWANLQALHLNLPFADDDEFGRLHAAIRLLLPILPALAASSPAADGRLTGLMDTRLEVYRTNSSKIPSVAGQVIPEPVFTRADYDRRIFRPMYSDIRPYDREGVLQHEFLNSRGAIARFDRGAIEIRLLDMQECPAADIAVCGAVTGVLAALTQERWLDVEAQKSFPTEPLVDVLRAAICDADRAVLDQPAYLDCFGYQHATARCTAGELWHHLCDSTVWPIEQPSWAEPLQTILNRGPLARRLVRRLGGQPTRAQLTRLYRRLCDCLEEGSLFD
jgi:gamma-glutamyl:cysteine ligase YbdK (ATP-grasp superfamily)